MGIKSKFLKVGVFLIMCLIGGGFMVKSANAWRFLRSENPNGLTDCLNGSGGRRDFQSIQFACTKAFYGYDGNGQVGQNACSGWLGPVGNSKTRIIQVSATALTTPVRLYGMCTDSGDTTSSLNIEGADGWLSGWTQHLRRGGPWGNVGSGTGGIINIPAFIAGATATPIGDGKIRYSRTVNIYRCHSRSGSCAYDEATIFLDVGGTPPPPPVEVDCNTWVTASSGTTSVVTKVRNTNSRFNNIDDQGVWQGTVYAKPEDRIAWHTCYYPGVQYKANDDVSRLSITEGGGYGTVWKGYRDLPGNTCATGPYEVNDKKLYKAMLDSPTTDIKNGGVGQHWQNKYRLLKPFDLEGRLPTGSQLDTWFPNNTEFGYGIGFTEINEAHNEANTFKADVGNIFKEGSETGTPRVATTRSENLPSVKIYEDGVCARSDGVKINGTVLPACVTGYNPTPGSSIGGTNPDGHACYVNNHPTCSTCEEYGNSYRCLKCTNTYNRSSITVAEVKNKAATGSASVAVPYNFENYISVELASDTVFAGETIEVSDVVVDTLPKENGVTKDTYATIVRKSKAKLVAYITNEDNVDSFNLEEPTDNDNGCSLIGSNIAKQCAEFGSNDNAGELNPLGEFDGKPTHNFGDLAKTYNAYDASAGDYMCFVAAVYPATSGDPRNYQDQEGDHKWRYSGPSCARIAKKPTFQVWGGDMYSVASPLYSPLSEKNNLYVNYFDEHYKLSLSHSGFRVNAGNTTYFGSWIEEGLILGGNGNTSNVASGAALGKNPERRHLAYSGSLGTLCDDWVPLTFSNNCSNMGSATGSGIGSVSGNSSELIDYWVKGVSVSSTVLTSIEFDGTPGDRIESATGADIRYVYKSGGNLNVSGKIKKDLNGKGKTYLIKVVKNGIPNAGNVKITDNIVYEDGFTSLGQISKAIIYAENDINIECGVTRVDAILIAGNKINTCSNADPNDDSDSKRANRLEIFGTAITKNITLGRTFGAAAWDGKGDGTKPEVNGQGEAAEVFNYDSSILMWSEFMSSSAETDTLQTVYQTELAPRY